MKSHTARYYYRKEAGKYKKVQFFGRLQASIKNLKKYQ